jgi:hypothetical protein
MALDRSQVSAPVVPSQAVQVDVLGGELIVQGLMLGPRLALAAARQRLAKPIGDETDAQAQERAAGEVIALTLAQCVLADDGKPLWSAEQWHAFGGQHIDVAVQLWQVAQRLNGHDVEAASGN